MTQPVLSSDSEKTRLTGVATNPLIRKSRWLFGGLFLACLLLGGIWISGLGQKMLFRGGHMGKGKSPNPPVRPNQTAESADNPDMSFQSELCRAVESGNLTAARKALESGADPDRHPPDDAFPLYLALWNKDARAVKLLLEAGADPNIASNPLQGTPLFTAVDRRDKESVILLLKAGADPCYKVEHDTPASWARKKGDNEIAFILWTASPCWKLPGK